MEKERPERKAEEGERAAVTRVVGKGKAAMKERGVQEELEHWIPNPRRFPLFFSFSFRRSIRCRRGRKYAPFRCNISIY